MKYYLVFELGNLNNLKVWIDFYANNLPNHLSELELSFNI